MDHDHFWLDERQFARLAPYLPSDTRGVPRVDAYSGRSRPPIPE